MTLTADEARKRVAAGAAYLDVVEPCWFMRVDLESFDMSHHYFDVVGQVRRLHDIGGSYTSGLKSIGLPLDGTMYEVAKSYGFDIREGEGADGHDMLEHEWHEAIMKRRVTEWRAKMGMPQEETI